MSSPPALFSKASSVSSQTCSTKAVDVYAEGQTFHSPERPQRRVIDPEIRRLAKIKNMECKILSDKRTHVNPEV